MKFSTLLNSVVQLIGGDSAEIDAATFRFVRDAATHRLRIWWIAAQWAETVRTIDGSVLNNIFSPPILGDFDVMEAFSKDPRKDVSALELDFSQDQEHIYFTRDYDDVFLRVKQPCPVFSGEPTTADVIQASGVDFYYDGNFWLGGVATAGAIAMVNGNKVEVPNRAMDYLVRAIYADFLRSNNQHEQAASEEQSAEGVLNIELERFYSRKGQTPPTRVETYGN
jgi:hypothetical protein